MPPEANNTTVLRVADVATWPYEPAHSAGPYMVVYREAYGQEDGDRLWFRHETARTVDSRLRHVYATFATASEAYEYGDRELDTTDYEFAVVDMTTGQEAPRLPPPTREGKRMIDLNVKREGGRLYLYVNAKGLHDTLDRIGVPFSGEMYTDRPRATTAVCDRSSHVLSTETLLKRQYPAKYDLSAVYTEPTNSANLKRLVDSAFEQTRRILEHYQPIDIKVSIQKKVLKPDQG